MVIIFLSILPPKYDLCAQSLFFNYLWYLFWLLFIETARKGSRLLSCFAISATTFSPCSICLKYHLIPPKCDKAEGESGELPRLTPTGYRVRSTPWSAYLTGWACGKMQGRQLAWSATPVRRRGTCRKQRMGRGSRGKAPHIDGNYLFSITTK